ncbi:MAG: hypothetical protein E6G77_24890 [Alphaproteobacteria bacterium]|nr:MAG: hypothetical protein E6G77_24890 [Alphaproteobacteria bacterium]
MTPDEAALITPLLRDKLADPFEFWKVEFDLAFSKVKKEGGDALDFLAKRHASSLSVLAPTDYAPERQWLLSRLFAPRDDAVEANGRGGQRVYRLTETPRGWRSGPIGIRRRR